MPIPLQPSIVYGPVRSRRLGISLGINILPVDLKACNFNCVYCQYGSTPGGWETLSKRIHWPGTDAILAAVESSLRTLSTSPDHLTFAGNGEPTAHPDFPAIVDGVIALKDRYLPKARTAILSNASFLHIPSVRRAILRIDVKMLKLDCGSERMFRRYNRSTMVKSFRSLVDSMKGLDGMIVQSLFTGGDHGNMDEASVHSWLDRVGEISPNKVQIYSLDRDCEDKTLIPASNDELSSIKKLLDGRGIPSEVF